MEILRTDKDGNWTAHVEMGLTQNTLPDDFLSHFGRPIAGPLRSRFLALVQPEHATPPIELSIPHGKADRLLCSRAMQLDDGLKELAGVLEPRLTDTNLATENGFQIVYDSLMPLLPQIAQNPAAVRRMMQVFEEMSVARMKLKDVLMPAYFALGAIDCGDARYLRRANVIVREVAQDILKQWRPDVVELTDTKKKRPVRRLKL